MLLRLKGCVSFYINFGKLETFFNRQHHSLLIVKRLLFTLRFDLF